MKTLNSIIFIGFMTTFGSTGACSETEQDLSADLASDSIQEQIHHYKSILATCGKNTATQAEGCQQKFNLAFAAFEKSFKSCTPTLNSTEVVVSQAQCNSLEKFISKDFVLNSPSFSQVSKALKFINLRTQANRYQKQTSL